MRRDSPRSLTLICDVADTGALRAALARVVTELGPVDLLVNNAALDPAIRLADIAEEDFRRTFDVNFFAPVAATLAVMEAMVERGRGTVITVSSDGGRLPSRGRAPTRPRRLRSRPSPSRSRSAWRPRASGSTSSTPLSCRPSSGSVPSAGACAVRLG